MQQADGFVSLAALLRESKPNETPVIPIVPADVEEAVRAARLFRAATTDATHAALEAMLPRIAREVIGRELQLAPCDIRAILQRALDRYFESAPVRVRAHPDEAAYIDCEFPVRADTELQPGDVCIDLRDGCIDATLNARIELVLRTVLR